MEITIIRRPVRQTTYQADGVTESVNVCFDRLENKLCPGSVLP